MVKFESVSHEKALNEAIMSAIENIIAFLLKLSPNYPEYTISLTLLNIFLTIDYYYSSCCKFHVHTVPILWLISAKFSQGMDEVLTTYYKSRGKIWRKNGDRWV